jgi:hypothetical protein
MELCINMTLFRALLRALTVFSITAGSGIMTKDGPSEDPNMYSSQQ